MPYKTIALKDYRDLSRIYMEQIVQATEVTCPLLGFRTRDRATARPRARRPAPPPHYVPPMLGAMGARSCGAS